MQVKDIIKAMEEWAPPSYQESYDNSGLICGTQDQEVSKVICSLDCTEAVVEEAIEKGANVIIAHHPIVFKGLTSLTGKNYVERTIIKAIKHDIAIYACHTNLDASSTGVNKMIGERLGLIDLEILSPKKGILNKLVVYVPSESLEKVRIALFDAGAGQIGAYDHCSFSSEGNGTFRGLEDSTPFVGEKGKDHIEPEHRLEVVLEGHMLSKAVAALQKNHPYEEVAYDIIPLQNKHHQVGSGMIGNLKEEISIVELLKALSQAFHCKVLKYTGGNERMVKRIAYCGGSGSFLINDSIKSGADVFITGDIKYHQFFDAEDHLAIIDIGHFEFEQFTPDLIQSFLAKNFPTFAVLLSGEKTNPVHYFIS